MIRCNRNITFLSPTQAPNPLFYEFFYDVDETNPVIVHEPQETLDDQATALDIEASVTDFFTGIREVIIEFKINGIEQSSVIMEKDFTDGFRPDLYVGTIPLPDIGLSENDLLEYRIIAVDKSPAKNSIISPSENEFYNVTLTKTLDAIHLYVNDFEIDKGDFSGNGFSVTRPAGFSDPAIHSIHPYTNAGQNNTRNFFYNLRLPIILRKVDALIQFDEVVLVEPGDPDTKFGDTEFWDYVIVEGRKTDSQIWQPFLSGYDSKTHSNWLAVYNNIVNQNSTGLGRSSLFQERTIDMQENGNFSQGDTVLIRFRLFSDPFAVGWGWAIDNLRIQDTPVAIEDFIEKREFKVFPNPVGGQFLQVEAEFKQEIKAIQLEISDIYGRLVYSQKFPSFEKQFSQSIEMGALPKGIYLLTMKLDGHEQISRRVVRQ